MRLLICAGGTGGGVYPALAVLQTLPVEMRQSVLWIGSIDGMERDLVEREMIPFKAIQAAGVHGVGLHRLPANAMKLARGYHQARRILKDFQPDVMFFTGGYVAMPVALAGRHVPSILYVPDIEPGLALKVLARLADRIAVTTEKSRAYFPKHAPISVTGYPVRPDLISVDRRQALNIFGLSDNLPVLLVFGGSSGARSINRVVLAILRELLSEMQIIHVVGKLDWEEVNNTREQLATSGMETIVHQRYKPYPYLYNEMGAALVAADLAICRAGASILGELPLAGLPSILVPYPYAWQYQKINAEFLVDHGAAVMILDQDLQQSLLPLVITLMHDQIKREKMRERMCSLARPEAAKALADLLLHSVQSKRQERITS